VVDPEFCQEESFVPESGILPSKVRDQARTGYPSYTLLSGNRMDNLWIPNIRERII
jgi:hypothetical protein